MCELTQVTCTASLVSATAPRWRFNENNDDDFAALVGQCTTETRQLFHAQSKCTVSAKVVRRWYDASFPHDESFDAKVQKHCGVCVKDDTKFVYKPWVCALYVGVQRLDVLRLFVHASYLHM